MSTLLWAGYVALVGALAAGAAYVVEPVARALRWPTRALWAGALAAQLGALAWALVVAGAARPHGAFVGAWMAATVAAGCFYLRSARLLRRERGRWRVTVAEEMPVWVSERTGPAVVGFLRSIVVAPAWAMAMRERDRRLLLRHEAEHVAAWDPTLLLAGLATCALVPWSPAAWWALARLRLAIEVDCDRRVLRAEPDVAAYGELLVAMSARVEAGAATLAAFAERRLPLEERIEAMTARRERRAGWRWSLRAAAAATLLLGACVMPYPRTMVVVVQQPAAAPVVGMTTDTVVARSSVARSSRNDEFASRHALIGRVVRAHFDRPDVADLAPNTIVFVAIDFDGTVLEEVREPWPSTPGGDRSYGVSPDTLRRVFPARDLTTFRHTGAMHAQNLGIPDVDAAVVYAYRTQPEAPDVVAMRAAISRLFPSGAPRDTAVGVAVAFAHDWSIFEARRLPVDSVPSAIGVRPSRRERLLPALRGRDVLSEGATTGVQPGLAPGSVTHYWRMEDPARPRGRLPIPWITERTHEAVDRHFDGRDRPTGAVTLWVLLDHTGRTLQVVEEPRLFPLVDADTVRARVPLARERQLEGFGNFDGAPFGLGGGRVVWVLEMKPEDVRRRGLPATPRR